MESTGQLTDENQKKNLGKTLIQWIRTVNESKAKYYNRSESLTEKNKPARSHISDHISLNTRD